MSSSIHNNHRSLICTLIILCHLYAVPVQSQSMIMTINGAIPPDSMGMTLIHEHVFLDWSGADQIDESSWNTHEAIQIIMPYLTDMKDRGVKTFLECTPAYLGRNPELLVYLSGKSSLQIITNTGYYAARQYEHLPAHFYQLSASEIAELWTAEYENGIDSTGIRPGFIKIGVDSKDELSDIDSKLVKAAALAHLNTGLTIVGHTGDDTTAAQQLEILEANSVSPDAFVWTHAQSGTSKGHIRMANKGTWVSLDGMGWITPTAEGDSSDLVKYVDFLVNLKQSKLLSSVLISHDSGWYTVGSDNQSDYKPYIDIFDLVKPALRRKGFNDEDFYQLLVENPKKAYTISVRRLK